MACFSFSSLFTSLVTSAVTAVVIVFFSPFNDEIQASVKLLFIPDPLVDDLKKLKPMIDKVKEMNIRNDGYLQPRDKDDWISMAEMTVGELSLVLVPRSESNAGDASTLARQTNSTSAQESGSSIPNGPNEIQPVKPKPSRLQENDDQPSKRNAEMGNSSAGQGQTNTPSVESGSGSPLQSEPNKNQPVVPQQNQLQKSDSDKKRPRCKLHRRAKELILRGEVLLTYGELPPKGRATEIPHSNE